MELPSIRVAVTEQCNLRCDYCPEGGDSVTMQAERIARDELERIVGAALEVGFTNFSLTGGEPLLSDTTAETTFALAQLINATRPRSSGYTKLNTNGANLLDYYEGVKAAGFDELKISLDSLRADIFTKISHRNRQVFDKTIEGILRAKNEIPIRLQTVVGRYNIDEIPDMIQFCIDNGLDIKLFDLSSYDNALAGSSHFADFNFVSLADIEKNLLEQYGTPEIKLAVGGVGHAKKVYRTPEGTAIELRDSTEAAHYSDSLCGDCARYMCQDGLCNIVIAADGHIQLCREGGIGQTIQTRDNDGRLGSDVQLKEALAKAAAIFYQARPVARSFQPHRKSLPIAVLGRQATIGCKR